MGRKKILVVDDNEIILELMKEYILISKELPPRELQEKLAEFLA